MKVPDKVWRSRPGNLLTRHSCQERACSRTTQVRAADPMDGRAVSKTRKIRRAQQQCELCAVTLSDPNDPDEYFRRNSLATPDEMHLPWQSLGTRIRPPHVPGLFSSLVEDAISYRHARPLPPCPTRHQKTDRNEARSKMAANDTDEHIRWSSTHPTDETGEPTPDLL